MRADADALPALANVSARPLTQDEWAEPLRIAVAPNLYRTPAGLEEALKLDGLLDPNPLS
jgi:hypothetical protein